MIRGQIKCAISDACMCSPDHGKANGEVKRSGNGAKSVSECHLDVLIGQENEHRIVCTPDIKGVMDPGYIQLEHVIYTPWHGRRS